MTHMLPRLEGVRGAEGNVELGHKEKAGRDDRAHLCAVMSTGDDDISHALFGAGCLPPLER